MRGTSLCTSPGLRSTCGPPAFPTGGRSSGPDRSALSGQGLYWAPDGDLWVIAYDCPPSDIELGDDDLSDPAEMSILNFDGAALKSVVTLRDPVRRSRFPDHRLLGSVQPLGSDEVLLVAARTAGEPNARVVDLEGVTVREFMLATGSTTCRPPAPVRSGLVITTRGRLSAAGPSRRHQTRFHTHAGIFPNRSTLSDGSNNEHSGLIPGASRNQPDCPY